MNAYPWPICVDCRKTYIPVATLQGCPWCSGQAARPDPNETWRERKTRRAREARAAARNAT
jgi:hypothetical protein